MKKTAAPSPLLLREQTLEGETLQFTSFSKEPDRLHRCMVRDCELVLEHPCSVNFLSCTFENCTLRVKEQCAQMWYNNRWLNCTFIGEYAMGFGFRNEDCPLPDGPMVVGCDFGQAVGAFTLLAADLPTISYPTWPHFTILEPGKHAAELQAIEFSKALYVWWYGFSRDAHPSYSSKTMNWERFVESYRVYKPNPKDYGPYTEEIRTVLGKLPYVIM